MSSEERRRFVEWLELLAERVQSKRNYDKSIVSALDTTASYIADMEDHEDPEEL